MIAIQAVDHSQTKPMIREILWEYLQWANDRVIQEYGVSFDIAAMLEQDLGDLGKFAPPTGCTLLGTFDQDPAGIVFLKSLKDDCGEVKRLYVRPAARRHGLGRALVERLCSEAARLGYARLRLDSPHFMVDAHRLYRALGFQEIEPYPGSEIPPAYQHNWVFMQKELGPAEPLDRA